MNRGRSDYSSFFFSGTRKVLSRIRSFTDTPRDDYVFCTCYGEFDLLFYSFESFPQYLFSWKDSSGSDRDSFDSSVSVFCTSLYRDIDLFERFLFCTLSIFSTYSFKYFRISYSDRTHLTVSVFTPEYVYEYRFPTLYQYGCPLDYTLSSLFYEFLVCTFWTEYRCLRYVYSCIYDSLLVILYFICYNRIGYYWKYLCSYRMRGKKSRT